MRGEAFATGFMALPVACAGRGFVKETFSALVTESVGSEITSKNKPK